MSALQELIEQTRVESFRPDADVSDAHVLGVMIARHFGWDGRAIAETIAHALVEANFHAAAEFLQTRFQALLAGS